MYVYLKKCMQHAVHNYVNGFLIVLNMYKFYMKACTILACNAFIQMYITVYMYIVHVLIVPFCRMLAEIAEVEKENSAKQKEVCTILYMYYNGGVIWTPLIAVKKCSH